MTAKPYSDDVIYAGNKQAAERVCAGISREYAVKAMAYCCDVADYEAVRETVEKIREKRIGYTGTLFCI